MIVFYQSINRSIDQSIDKSINRQINQSINQSINQVPSTEARNILLCRDWRSAASLLPSGSTAESYWKNSLAYSRPTRRTCSLPRKASRSRSVTQTSSSRSACWGGRHTPCPHHRPHPASYQLRTQQEGARETQQTGSNPCSFAQPKKGHPTCGRARPFGGGAEMG